MRVTNPDNLPKPIFDVINEGSRPIDPHRIHVTQLIDPPKIRALKVRYDEEIEVPATGLLVTLLGRAFHKYMETQLEGNNEVRVEGQFEIDGEKYIVSGMYDRNEDGEIIDYKVTSVWSIVYADDKTYEEQMNCYAYLAGPDVAKSLKVIAILRDWQKGKAYDRNYPKLPIAEIEIPLWEPDVARSYILNRLRLHHEALNGNIQDCTDTERWATSPKYAVMKKGRKSAVRVLDSEESAVEYMQTKGLTGAQYWIEFREPKSKRCADYCTVFPYCDQARREFGEIDG